ncbi:MAG: hypothetical protein Q8M51_06000 [Polaromonas sp.]|uniref:hypothetical protein n=1 Tax=Polaromonas sp. TaxID=1869339 RepID=UPI0027317FD0|nr:hypothetical protein [Polaromonas sp.]MDP1741621.1 hypothetical protein [Polaromonas sp.]MDP3355399.1 hypothetical protein [Polaromonas sp.]
MRLQLSGRVFAVCGLWLAALGVYFLLLRPALLPEDPRFMGASIETLRAAAPGLERWLGHVFNVMGGFMIATGSLTTLVACRYLAIRARGTLTALVATGTASVGLMSATNFMLHSDFRWLLLVPALLWLMGVVCYLREGAPESTTGVN